MPSTALVVEIHVLDIEHGVWCPHCLLSSAMHVTYAAVSPTTLRIRFRGEVTGCHDCGRRLPKEPR